MKFKKLSLKEKRAKERIKNSKKKKRGRYINFIRKRLDELNHIHNICNTCTLSCYNNILDSLDSYCCRSMYKFLIDKNLLKNEKFLREHIIGEFANAIIICVSTESKSLKQYLPPPKRKEYNWVTLRNLVGRPCSGDNPFLLIRKSDLSLI